MPDNVALIVGSSGIVGGNLAERLVKEGWKVYGLARRPLKTPGVIAIAADLQDPESLRTALKDVKPTHVFLATWLRQESEAENIRVNGAMVRNLLDELSGRSVQHVALVTGGKHYMGPFEAYGKGVLPATPFREEQPRLEVDNFYYTQEDEVFAAAEREGFGWSVHRPSTVIGYALGNAMNMGVTLAVYATICRELGRPLIFPGSQEQWESLSDVTDANQLAAQLLWAATEPTARNQSFNIVNGDVFRWKWMWQQLADWFGVKAEGPGASLEQQLTDSVSVWTEIAKKYGLAQADISKLVSAWHTDADLGRPFEVVYDMSKSRKLGFVDYQPTDESFFELFERLRAERIIP